MGRTKKFLKNSITTALYQLIVMFSGFITVGIILKVYGSEINGLVSSINQFIAYFKLVEAGLSSAAIYALYKPLADNDHRAINAVVVATKNFYKKTGYIFVLLTIGLALVYPFIVKLDTLSPISIGILVLILGVNGALEFFTLAKYRALLTADQKTYVISLASTVYTIANTIIIVFLANLKVDIVVLWFVTIFSMFLRTLILVLYVRAKYKWINYQENPNYSSLNQRWNALYLQILGAIQTGAPIIILTIITKDMKQVSIYSVYFMVIVGINGILGIFKTGLFASFGDVIVKGETKILQKSFKEFEFFFYSLITIIFSVAFILILPFIRIYTSDVTDINYDLPGIGYLFVLNGVLHNIKTPQGMLVMSAGLFKETKMQTTLQGAIVIILGIFLAPTLGIEGVLIASIISNLYRCIDLFVFIPKNVTKLPVKDTFSRILKMIFSMVIIVTPFWFISINTTNYISWFFIATIVGVYAVIIVGLIDYLFDRKDMKSTVNRLLTTLKR
jgi:O-antigen/teichoic acid export membrane protein